MVLNRFHHVELEVSSCPDALHSTHRPSSDTGLAGIRSWLRDVDRERSSSKIAQDKTTERQKQNHSGSHCVEAQTGQKEDRVATSEGEGQ